MITFSSCAPKHQLGPPVSNKKAGFCLVVINNHHHHHHQHFPTGVHQHLASVHHLGRTPWCPPSSSCSHASGCCTPPPRSHSPWYWPPHDFYPLVDGDIHKDDDEQDMQSSGGPGLYRGSDPPVTSSSAPFLPTGQRNHSLQGSCC